MGFTCQPKAGKKNRHFSVDLSSFFRSTEMSKFPGLYSDIGKKARDVLYKDFAQEPKLYQIKYKDYAWSFDLSCKIQDIVPGLSALVGLVIPQSGMVELQYIQDYFGVSGGIGMKEDTFGGLSLSPVMNFSGVVGNSLFTFGSAVTFDMAKQEFYKFNAGLSYNTDLLLTSLTMDKLDAMRASCYYTVNPLTNTAIAAELRYRFSTRDTSLAIGAKHALFPSTVLKGKVDTHGRVAALIQQGLWQNFFVTVGGEVDLMDERRIPNIGLSMALRV